MKLVLRRDQREKKGIFGGHKGMDFYLYAQVRLDREEQGLFDRLKVSDVTLVSHPVEIRRDGKWVTINRHITAGDLLRGWEHSELGFEVIELFKLEADIKTACQNFKILLEKMRTFGGEEVIDVELPKEESTK